MRNLILCGLLLLTPFFYSMAIAQETNESLGRKKLETRIYSILQGQVDSNYIPGAVVMIKHNGQVIYEKAFGNAQILDKDGKPLPKPEVMTAGHLFDIASLTKVIGTTTSVMLLADKGMLNIEHPVGKYLPAFNTPDKKEITIRHLLTHTSGLYDWYPLYYRSDNRKKTYKLIGKLPLKYQVGQQRQYSDPGFTVLGEIIEKVSGQRLDLFQQEHIFLPLGMNHTLYNPYLIGRYGNIAATSYGNPYEYRMVHDTSLGFAFKEINPDQWNGWRHYTLKGEVNDGNTWYACGGISGAAGLFSTAEDLQHLVDILLNKGMTASGRFISEKTIEAFLKQDAFKNGLGWMMDASNSFMKNAPAGSYGHTGFTGTSIVVIPSENSSIILLVNRQNTGLLQSKEYYNLNPVRQRIFEAVMEYLKQ